MKTVLAALFQTILDLCTGANWGVPDLLQITDNEINIARTMYKYFMVIGIGMTIVYFIMEMNKQYALQARDLNIKTVGVPFLILLASIAVLSQGSKIIGWILSFNNSLVKYAQTNFTMTGSGKGLADLTDKIPSGDNIVNALSFMNLLVLLIPALICWFIGVIVGLVFKYKAYAYKIEVIFRTGIAPIALGDVYSGENSTAVKFIKRFLALGLYAMAFVVVVNIGASMIGADFLEGLTSGDTWKILGGILNCFVVPFAELGALGVAKQACNEVLGV